jgi:hypothetical protein
MLDGMMNENEWGEANYNGYGIFTWPNGDTFMGSWRNGRREGAGIFRSASGRECVDRDTSTALPNITGVLAGTSASGRTGCGTVREYSGTRTERCTKVCLRVRCVCTQVTFTVPAIGAIV